MSIRKETTALFMSLIICALLLFLAPSAAFTFKSILTSATAGGITNTTSFTAGSTIYVTVSVAKLSTEAINNVTAFANLGSTQYNSTNSSCASNLNDLYGYNGSGYGYGSSGIDYGYGTYGYGSLGVGYGSGYGFGNGTAQDVTCTFAFDTSTPTAWTAGNYTIDVYVNGNPAINGIGAAWVVINAAAVTPSSQSCTPAWNTCTPWSACSATGVQTRTCTDANSCGVTTGKPDEVSPCIPVVPCVESWTCGDYGACSATGYKTRLCTDAHSCGTQVSRPSELTTCAATTPPVLTTAIIETTATEEGGAEATIPDVKAGETATISMSVASTISTGISSITLSADVALSNVKVTVNPISKPAGVAAPPAENVLKYIEIKAENLKAGDISKATIKFELKKSDVKNVARIKLARFVNGAWINLPTVFTGETSDSYTFEAETPGFSYFAVVEITDAQAGVVTQVTEEQPVTTAAATAAAATGPNYGLFIIAILVVIGAGYWWYSQKKPWSKK